LEYAADNPIWVQYASLECEVQEALLLDVEAHEMVTMRLRQVSCFIIEFEAY